MDILGKWKVAKTLYIDQQTFDKSWESPSVLLESGKIDEEYASLLSAVYEFCSDGTVRIAMPIPDGVPQEDVDAAVKAGEITLCGDGMMLLETKQWKEENGKTFYDTGIKGTVFDEEVSSLEEIKEVDGLIELLTNRLEKIC